MPLVSIDYMYMSDSQEELEDNGMPIMVIRRLCAVLNSVRLSNSVSDSGKPFGNKFTIKDGNSGLKQVFGDLKL